MPVHKYRTFDEASDALVLDRDDPRLARRLAWVLSFTARLAPGRPRVRGVSKFRSFDEAQAARGGE
jgi:hypothetical protein